MVEVVTEILIERPLHQVKQFAENPSNASQWYDNIRSAEWDKSHSLYVGAEIAFIVGFLGEMAFRYKVTDLGERHLEMETEEEGYPMKTRYEWEEINENLTKMTLRNTSNPTGFSKLLSPVKALILKRANLKDLERLKRILENGH